MPRQIYALIDRIADAVPDDPFPEPFVVPGHVPAEPDQEGLAHQVPVRHETPVTAVVAVVAVIAHDEIFSRGYHYLRQRNFLTVGRQDVMSRAIEAFRQAQGLLAMGIAFRSEKIRPSVR